MTDSFEFFFASFFLRVETIFSANQSQFVVSEGEKPGLGSNKQVSYQGVEHDCIV